MSEAWKIIPSAPEYAASTLGRIKRVVPSHGRFADRVLKPAVNLHGYLFISACTGGRKVSRTVHSLVCEAFHGPKPTPSHEVAHGDGDQRNNHPDNLRWATRKENFEDRDRHGRTARGDRSGPRLHPECLRRGEAHGKAKLTEEAVRAIRASDRTQKALAAQYGVRQAHISDVISRRVWRHI